MDKLAQGGDQQSNLLGMQVEALYKGAPASVMSVFGAILTLLTYWSEPLEFFLSCWFGCICVVAITHLTSAALRPGFGLLPRWEFGGWTPRGWSRLIAVIYFSSGSCWGLGGAWLLLQGNDHQTLVICCIAMGAVTVTFPAVVYRPAFNLFQIPIFAAFSVALAISDLAYNHILSVAAAVLCLALAIIAQTLGEQLTLAFRLSEENRRLVEQLAARGSLLEEENRELTAQTMTDPLTGLANRRQLMEFLRQISGRCAVLVVDVDHFKSYNDSFGHAEGDICLMLVADALHRGLQPSIDLAARHGGEEFVVVLQDLSRERALDMAEVIRSNIQSLSARHPQQMRRLVTASIGLAYRSDKRQKSASDLFAQADSALYAAKKAGRNRVMLATGGHPAAAE